MYIPNKESAYITSDKISGYLLSLVHPVGKFKASFFLEIGFSRKNPEALKLALLSMAHTYEVTMKIQTDFGIKYAIDGDLFAPNNRNYPLRTVWMIENQKRNAYLITAYPL